MSTYVDSYRGQEHLASVAEGGSPRIADSAHRHGIKDGDMLHAYRNAFRILHGTHDATLYIGADQAGNLLEVGISTRSGKPVVVHAMKLRDNMR